MTIPSAWRCPVDGAALRSWEVQANGPCSYTHTDGTTHGDLYDMIPLIDAQMALAVAAVRWIALHQAEIQARESLARMGTVS